MKDRILKALRQAGGRLPYGDASSPAEIWAAFGCSKKALKQVTIGILYRERKIVIEGSAIRSA